jgi:peptidoglycan/LPS O-acetylase OafA/YrhL
VLSGFLITNILAREKSLGSLSFRRFYTKRVLRIFPIFYLTLTIAFFVFDLPPGELLANLFYVSNYFYSFNTDPSPLRHTWSLSVEEQFYLFWPLVIAFCPAAKLGRLLVAVIVVVLFASAVLAATFMDFDNYSRLAVRGLPFRMLSLGVGAYIALHPGLVDRLKVNYLLMLILACPVLILSLYGDESDATPVFELLAMAAWSVSIFLLVLKGGDDKLPVVKSIFENRMAVYVGQISYGLYLYHYVILFGLGFLTLDARGSVSIAEFMLAVVLTFAVASFSFHVIETPFLRLKKRMASNSLQARS